MFAAIYLILRIIGDKFISGNVRVPVLADKIGAGVMGVIAGMIGVGVVAFAAQSMPFNGSIAGYSRLALNSEPRSVIIPPSPGQRQFQDAVIFDELQVDSFSGNEPLQEQGLILPVDDFMLGIVTKLSSGSLSYGDRDLASIHPDWLFELFGQRLGIEPGVRRTALNNESNEQVTVAAPVVTLPSVNQIDDEPAKVRAKPLFEDKVRRPDPGHSLVVVLVTFLDKAADQTDHFVRFSTASVRLVGNGNNYFPLGTINATGELVVNKPDDYLVADTSKNPKGAEVAFVFDVPTADIITGESVRNGVFIEVKRLAREDLSGMAVKGQSALAVTDGVMHKGVAPAPQVPVAPPVAPPAAVPPKAAPATPAAPR
jgi:hypothetical protein